MTVGHQGFVVKAKKAGQREPGRFVTLKNGRVIFIPEGKRTKWADVKDKVLASQKAAAIREKKLEAERRPDDTADQGRDRMSNWLDGGAQARFYTIPDPHWQTAPHQVRSDLKAQVAKELSEATGIPEDKCSEFVKQWAKSSNDADMRSLAIQRDAALEFGTELSDFTKGRIRENQEARSEAIEREMERFDEDRTWAEESIDEASPQYHPLMESADQRKLLRAMYDSTQRSLAARGIKEVRMYRGVGFDGDPEDWYHRMDDPIEIETNALESWSVGKGVGGDFAVRAAAKQVVGVQFETTVPAERILSCPVTGFGCLTEGEVLVLGGVEGDTAEIGQIYEAPGEGEYA